MSVDPESMFPIRQAVAHLGLRPRDEAIEPPPLAREMIQRDLQAAFTELDPHSKQMGIQLPVHQDLQP